MSFLFFVLFCFVLFLSLRDAVMRVVHLPNALAVRGDAHMLPATPRCSRLGMRICNALRMCLAESRGTLVADAVHQEALARDCAIPAIAKRLHVDGSTRLLKLLELRKATRLLLLLPLKERCRPKEANQLLLLLLLLLHPCLANIHKLS